MTKTKKSSLINLEFYGSTKAFDAFKSMSHRDVFRFSIYAKYFSDDESESDEDTSYDGDDRDYNDRYHEDDYNKNIRNRSVNNIECNGLDRDNNVDKSKCDGDCNEEITEHNKDNDDEDEKMLSLGDDTEKKDDYYDKYCDVFDVSLLFDEWFDFTDTINLSLLFQEKTKKQVKFCLYNEVQYPSGKIDVEELHEEKPIYREFFRKRKEAKRLKKHPPNYYYKRHRGI